MAFFDNKNLLIKLELDGKVLYSIVSSEIKSEITIGRSNTCVWRIPPTDRSASNLHAKLFYKSRKLYIIDENSRNGIFHKGTRITEHKLEDGDRISVGDCILVVEKVETKNKKQAEIFDSLEQRNGLNSGKIYKLSKSKIVIGSASDCEIVCGDSLVSQHHTVIDLNEDGCWIRDLGSRNGTSVNGLRLSSSSQERGRLLRDGDIISVAYIEFRFLDRNIEHIHSHFWLKLFVVFATLFIMLSGYFFWQYSQPSAKSYIDSARLYASKKEFGIAEDLLKTATNAKNADIHTTERIQLEINIKQWRTTINSWDKIKKYMVSGNWVEANKILSPMLTGNMEIWTWNNSDAVSSRTEALLTKRILDNYLHIFIEFRKSDISHSEMKRLNSEFSKVISSIPKNYPKFLTSIINASHNLNKEVERTNVAIDKIESAVNSIKNIDDIEFALTSLKRINETSNAYNQKRRKENLLTSNRVSEAYKRYIEPMEALLASRKIIDANIAYTKKLELDKLNRNLPLPSDEACQVSPILTEKRSELARLNKQVLADSDSINFAIQSLESLNLKLGKYSPALEIIFSQKERAKVMSCDCLSMKSPKWGRKEPVGNYDKILGVEMFYEFVSRLPEPFDTVIAADMGFMPKILVVKKIFSDLETFLKMFEVPSLKMFILDASDDNKIMQWVMFASQIIEKRDVMIAKYRAQALNSEGRDCIIKGGIVMLLSSFVDYSNDVLVKKVVVEHKKLRQRLSDLYKQEISPEKIQERADLVKKIGLPGSSHVRQIWY